MKKFFLPLFFAALAFGAVSCSDDDKVPGDPEGTVSLNMMNESNGKTLLGDSGIYIDKAQNFVTDGDCYLFALGKAGGLGAAQVKSLENPVPQAAVQAGYAYAAYRPGAMLIFHSGKLALPIGDSRVNYIKFYVVSPLSEGDKTVGAAIKYAVVRPETHGLPEYGSTVLRIDRSNYDHLEQEVSLTLPSDDCEYDFLDDGYGIRCEQRGRKLFFRLEDWFAHQFELYLRIRESYTKVYVDVDLPR